MTVQFTIDDEQMREVQRELGEFAHKAPNAISNALNRAITNTKSNIVKGVRSKYHIKAGEVRNSMKEKRSNRSSLSGEVRVSGSTLPLDRFKVSPKTVKPNRKSQLKIAVKKDGTKQILGAFIADLSGIKVMKRDTPKRLPISRLYGPSAAQMAGEESIVQHVNQQSYETFHRRLTVEINRILGG